LTGGSIDVSDYNGGKRGGRVKVRSKIEKIDKSTLAVTELPFGVTTTSLIDSIIKANDKGKIKIKRVADNTAKDVEVLIDLPPGESPDVAIDALYAFTNCEVSISPNACVIIDDKPYFLTVEDILKTSTDNTKELLRQELLIKQAELQEKWHMASLEKIFIENRIYREIEECESFEEVIETIDRELRRYVRTPYDEKQAKDQRLPLKRDITEEDIIKLTEIKIKRISKYNSFKADEQIARLEEELKQVQHDLDHLTDFAIAYFNRLLEKYGKGKERRTEITTFEQIERAEVVANNAKLYVNRKEGFIGYGLKKDEFVTDCSDIDDVIIFREDGKFLVTRITEKVFVGKNILHVDVWKKGDDRTTYNMMYVDAKSGRSRAKRFHVKAITRDREYDLTKGSKGSKVLYFSANPNGEAEMVNVQLTQGCSARIKIFDFDFGELAIKGRSSQGNIVTKYPIKKITLLEVGKSTLGALKVWMDEVSGKLNTEERGKCLGEFDTGDHVLAIYKNGSYEVAEMDMNRRFEAKNILYIGKFKPDVTIGAVYYDGNKKWTMVKRFNIETSTFDQNFPFISDHRSSQLLFVTVQPDVSIEYFDKNSAGEKKKEVLAIDEFIDVKGWKALGNKLSDQKITGVKKLKEEKEAKTKGSSQTPKDKLSAGDTIEFDIDPKDEGQGKLF
jgi:topoisomerase-4 subunit A